MRYLPFPFEQCCELIIDNHSRQSVVGAELAESVIELFQSLHFRSKADFTQPLVLKFTDPATPFLVISKYQFPVEHICVNDKGMADKIYTQQVGGSPGYFIHRFSMFPFIVLAPVGFTKRFQIREASSRIALMGTRNHDSWTV